MNLYQIFKKLPPKEPNDVEREIAKALYEKWMKEIEERILKKHEIKEK